MGGQIILNYEKTYLAVCFTANYLPGAIALDRALKRTNAKYGLVVVCFDDPGIIGPLRKNDIKYHIVQPIELPDYIDDINRKTNHSNWTNTFTKLKIFGLTQYSKIVFLDCDLLIIDNIDFLFDRPHMSAVSAGMRYGMNMGVPFNAGMMVIEPNREVEDKLIDLLLTMSKDRSDPFSDNDVLCALYPEWDKQEELHLSDRYNLIYETIHNYIEDGLLNEDDFVIIHFTGPVKPWMEKYLNPCRDPISCKYLQMYLDQLKK